MNYVMHEIMYVVQLSRSWNKFVYSCCSLYQRVYVFICFLFRADDFNDPIHLERISTLNTFTVRDLGAIRNDSLSTDYTSEFYRINEW
jgi:hypothetical protein